MVNNLLTGILHGKDAKNRHRQDPTTSSRGSDDQEGEGSRKREGVKRLPIIMI